MKHNNDLFENVHLSDRRIGKRIPNPTYISEVFLPQSCGSHTDQVRCDDDADNNPSTVVTHPNVYYGQLWVEVKDCPRCDADLFKCVFAVKVPGEVLALCCPNCWCVWAIYEPVNNEK